MLTRMEPVVLEIAEGATSSDPDTGPAKKILELTLREAVARHDSQIGVEHIALALTTIKQGLVPQILSAAGAPAAALRAAILDRYRQAS
jgi:ATP-dependent Clp protease ATP-binding subunit ClpA